MKIVFVCVVIFSCCNPGLLNDNPRHEQEPDLSILDYYRGVWDCEFTIESPSNHGEDKKCTGVVEGKWVVGEKFLEQVGKYRLNEDSQLFVIMTMMSFDQKSNRFQYDYYDSSGNIQRSFGNWDADAKTMTSTLKDDGKVTTIVADFSTVDVEHWSIETSDDEGKLITKIRGKNTRKRGK